MALRRHPGTWLPDVEPAAIHRSGAVHGAAVGIHRSRRYRASRWCGVRAHRRHDQSAAHHREPRGPRRECHPRGANPRDDSSVRRSRARRVLVRHGLSRVSSGDGGGAEPAAGAGSRRLRRARTPSEPEHAAHARQRQDLRLPHPVRTADVAADQPGILGAVYWIVAYLGVDPALAQIGGWLFRFWSKLL
ncbi:Conserved hypothetical protein (peptidase?) [Mycobacteroides abscessus]|nr:Conserved hypothetical protein (peptidase?) [Mycobacteroides abscessus]